MYSDNEEIFVEKTMCVTIMGGVLPPSDEDKAVGEGGATSYLEIDTAHNNMFHKGAAEFFYRRCQELGVPLYIVSRFAA